MKDNKHTIVVLDDDPDIGTMIRVMLEFRGYEVIVTERGKDMFDLLRERSVHLVITDLLLSGDDGREICATLKEPGQQRDPCSYVLCAPQCTGILPAGRGR